MGPVFRLKTYPYETRKIWREIFCLNRLILGFVSEPDGFMKIF